MALVKRAKGRLFRAITSKRDGAIRSHRSGARKRIRVIWIGSNQRERTARDHRYDPWTWIADRQCQRERDLGIDEARVWKSR